MPRYLDPRVEGTQCAGVQQRGHLVEHSEQARAVAGDGIPAHQGGDVLGRLQPAVIGQHHEMARRDARVGGEQQRYVDIPSRQSLQGQRPSRIE